MSIAALIEAVELQKALRTLAIYDDVHQRMDMDDAETWEQMRAGLGFDGWSYEFWEGFMVRKILNNLRGAVLEARAKEAGQ